MCHPDTRLSLLAQIYAWVHEEHGKPIFWLRGMAGTGKSTISRTVAAHFAGEKIPCASFFFKKGEGDRGNALRFFTTIASQLAQSSACFASGVRDAIEKDPAIVDKSKMEQFQKLLLNPLQTPTGPSPPPAVVIVVVDALDECDGEKDAAAILRLLPRATEARRARLKLFITSRPYLSIQLGFRDIGGAYRDVALHEIPESMVKHDITAYLRSELVAIRRTYNQGVPAHCCLRDDWPDAESIQELADKATPLFIFAATACRFVSDRRLVRSPKDLLVRFLNAQTNSQSDLDATYGPVLDQLSQGPTEMDLFRQVVGSIVLLESPLSAASLARLLGEDIGLIEGQLELLHSVLSIPSCPDMPVRLFHLSFRDYLLDRKGHAFWIDETETHCQLANRCLELLSSKLRKDVCQLRIPGTSRSEIGIQRVNDCLPPEVQYACQYWVDHLARSQHTLQDGGAVHTFLSAHLLHWLEALSLLGLVRRSLSMVDRLLGLLDVSLFLRYQPSSYLLCSLQAR